ncbi:flagellar hook-basal body complex protein FliE [Pseudovibrio denitrificans]|uniref:Flagellar hook-basal body complex protein FliE n=1 Tax=Pseudovibrio denitrificans TaxID=258256 RepID=A0A1I6Y6N0_9HYPH|nr:flagellar hook-basal body complex protein FliE [Pseudovibrio denitrificans]SFT45901.1 flagellar hook-basal body complex protein FliE [Pseudovibrio denitrificans]
MADLSALSTVSRVSTFTSGVNDVSSTARTRQYLVGGPQDTQATQGVQGSFADTMAEVVRETAGDLKTAEATSVAAVRGEVSAQKVVEAVMKAELSLKSAVAVRDKVVEAYQEFSRMSI